MSNDKKISFFKKVGLILTILNMGISLIVMLLKLTNKKLPTNNSISKN